MARILVTLTRDSVCAGDDGDAPHEKTVEVEPASAPDVFAREVATGYLPSVAGTGHSWDCVLTGVNVAQISISGVKALVPRASFGDRNRVHFVYHSAAF
jgi:hypothetical protein